MGKRNRRKNAQVRYWHGGWPGLEVGTLLKPPAELGIVMPTHLMPDDPTDPSWLHITTDRALAKAYAAHWRHEQAGPMVSGDLYLVQPLGDLHPDPDYPTGVSLRCLGAEVLAVAQRAVQKTPGLEAAFRRYNTWDDDSPMYSKDGYILPNLKMRDLGVTDADLRVLGIAADWMQANALAQRIISTRTRS